MTAEIAIMNKTGLALAADSKVTIGAGVKSFDTVSKIFPLSRNHPIALMVWGNPDFMEIPIEVICKEYRRKKGKQGEKTVEAWSKDFVKYLEGFTTHSDKIHERNTLCMLRSWFEFLRSSVDDEAILSGTAQGSTEYRDLQKRMLERLLERFFAADDFVSDAAFEKLVEDHLEYVESLVELYVGDPLDQSVKTPAMIFGFAALAKHVYSPASMGFVVAGYGEDEIFPCLQEFECDGYIAGRLKIKSNDPKCVSREMEAYIKPFAQGEMVHRFMDGADPEYREFASAMFVTTMMENCIAVLEQYGAPANITDESRGQIRTAVRESFVEAMKLVSAFQREKFSSPIIDMVKVLPKDELPHLAESLVALTSLKRHVSHDAETVGGPIDVALISKGDGLIWIKRKHYFKPELNPQFGAMYLGSVFGGKDEGSGKDRKPARQGGKKGGNQGGEGGA